MANNAATKVPGKNDIVMAAIVFTARESSFDVEASFRESSPVNMLTLVPLSSRAMMLKSCMALSN